ncbi:unnamed protein product [Brassicogethes aeneus]|uniref:Multifunctional methyltransferase subunit TRM112-like protein n=1 Tax=Brassicogethes aeneus TaxID=1431903 RepID=A0A9P0AT97_BRAAE|nr:unnamed protein product [Brassicogethes aeneus]
MKLITHNFLSSKCMKGVNVGFPLKISASDVKVTEVDFNPEFVARIMQKIDYPALYTATESIGHLEDLPKQMVENYENDEHFLKKVHHALLQLEVINGELICPETGRKFPITNGIPNMLLNEDEI